MASSTETTPTEVLNIRLKFLDDTQKFIQTRRNIPLGDFKQEHFSDQLTAGRIVRLIFQGRLLRDDRNSLESYGVFENSVVHVHVGTRPYASPTVNEADQSGLEGAAPLETGGGVAARLAVGPFSWFDLLLLYSWNIILAAWEWANRADEPAVPGQGQSILFRVRTQLRSFLRLFLDVLFGPSIRNANTRGRDDVRYNVGRLLVFLVFVKFLLLWTFVLLYPQIADRRSLILLVILSATTGLYFYFNRTNAGGQQDGRGVHAE